MSTRAQITIVGQEIKLYKHCDGYPSGVLLVLIPFVKNFMKACGFKEEYMMARLTMAFGLNEEMMRQERLKDPECPNYYKQPDYTGFGLDLIWHSDLEYIYKIYSDGSIDIFKLAAFQYDFENPTKSKPFAKIFVNNSIEQALQLCLGE